jgi:hypothetical protein
MIVVWGLYSGFTSQAPKWKPTFFSRGGVVHRVGTSQVFGVSLYIQSLYIQSLYIQSLPPLLPFACWYIHCTYNHCTYNHCCYIHCIYNHCIYIYNLLIHHRISSNSAPAECLANTTFQAHHPTESRVPIGLCHQRHKKSAHLGVNPSPNSSIQKLIRK